MSEPNRTAEQYIFAATTDLRDIQCTMLPSELNWVSPECVTVLFVQVAFESVLIIG